MKRLAIAATVVVTSCAGAGTAAMPEPGCRVIGQATGEDIARTSEACERARSRFADLFGEPVPAAEVVLYDSAAPPVGVERQGVALPWPTRDAMERQLKPLVGTDPAAVAGMMESQIAMLSHEIGHLLLGARYFGPAAMEGASRYGTPMPDWFDEAVAIWMEPDASIGYRLSQARALDSGQVRLAAILSAVHPHGDGRGGQPGISIAVTRSNCRPAADPDFCKNRPVGAATARRSRLRADGTVEADTLTGDDAATAGRLAAADAVFYPASIAVLSFVYEKGGAAAVRALAARLVLADRPPNPLVGLPGLPDDAQALEAAWRGWLGKANGS